MPEENAPRLDHHNCMRKVTQQIPGDVPGIHVHSDTAVSFGCGAVTSSDRWLQVQWPDSWSEVSIAAKEMAPIVMADLAPL